MVCLGVIAGGLPHVRAQTGAQRGEWKTYGGDLSGGNDGAPALRGNPFFLRWKDGSLSDFYFVMAETMPQDAPSSLSRKEYAEIISFILYRNDAAAGDNELVPDEER